MIFFQLRLDFNTFVITGPDTRTDSLTVIASGTPTAVLAGQPVSTATRCLTDTFSVTSPGGYTPPVICGTNTGQHSK